MLASNRFQGEHPMLRKEKTTVPQSSKENTGVVDGKNDKEEYQDDKGDDKGWVELQGADHGGGKIFKGVAAEARFNRTRCRNQRRHQRSRGDRSHVMRTPQGLTGDAGSQATLSTATDAHQGSACACARNEYRRED